MVHQRRNLPPITIAGVSGGVAIARTRKKQNPISVLQTYTQKEESHEGKKGIRGDKEKASERDAIFIEPRVSVDRKNRIYGKRTGCQVCDVGAFSPAAAGAAWVSARLLKVPWDRTWVPGSLLHSGVHRM